NQQVFTSVIVDSSSYPFRQFTALAALTEDRPLGAALRSAATAVRGIEGVASEPPPEVSLVPNVEHGPAIEARFWVDVQGFKPRTVQRQVNAALTAVASGQQVNAEDLDPGGAARTAKSPKPTVEGLTRRPSPRLRRLQK
ncbi:MAG: hypothetical protein M3010_06525, partial [Candidatus Dormibacteraeota bacterium]|nr:hypothetical protein [Candidatus Dormibacteraeota bacterium]